MIDVLVVQLFAVYDREVRGRHGGGERRMIIPDCLAFGGNRWISCGQLFTIGWDIAVSCM